MPTDITLDDLLSDPACAASAFEGDWPTVYGLSVTDVDSLLSEGLAMPGTRLTAIAGRMPMVDQVVDFGTDTFEAEADEDQLRKGILGRYRGIPLVTIRDYLDPSGAAVIPPDRLAFVGTGLGIIDDFVSETVASLT